MSGAKRMAQWTPLLLVAIPLCLGLLDVLLYWLGGNEATFSATMLAIRVKYPLSALATAYTLAVFLGHVFFPQEAEFGPPVHEVLARMMVALSPTFYALIIFAAGNGASAAASRAVDGHGQMAFAGWMLLCVVFGGAVGRFVLCQHVAPQLLKGI